MRLFAALLLASLPLLAQEQPSGDEAPEPELPSSDSPEAVHPPSFAGAKKRVQAFLIPMDENARGPTTRIAQAIEQVLLHSHGYEVVDLGHAMSVEATAEEASRAEEGRKLMQEGNGSAAARGFPEAAAKYQSALQAYDAGLSAVTAREYADAVLRYGAAVWMAGDQGPARETLALFVRLDPHTRIDVASVETELVPVVNELRAQAQALKHGTLHVETRPAGGRVLIDGEYHGPAPLRAELVPGKHLVRVEKAGFYPWSQLIDINAKKLTDKSMTLSATPTAASLNQIIEGASEELGRSAPGKNVSALAQKFSLERLVVGSVRTHSEGRALLQIALIDAHGDRILGQKTLQVVADGTDADQIEADAQTLMQALVAGDPDSTGIPAEVGGPPSRKLIMPGAAPSADDPSLVEKPVPIAPLVPVAPAPAPVMPAAPAPEIPSQQQASADPAPAPAPAKKKRTRGIKNVTGTEDWDSDDSAQQQQQPK